MAFTLFPRSIRFFELLIRQNQILKDVAADLERIFQDFTSVDEACKRINVKEVEADELCREIARQLSLSFITPSIGKTSTGSIWPRKIRSISSKASPPAPGYPAFHTSVFPPRK